MLIVSYDFASDRRRAKFARFLKRYGNKVQYSVYNIRNSQRVLRNILTEVEKKYKKEFGSTDSIYIFPICEACKGKQVRYGSAQHEEEDVVFL